MPLFTCRQHSGLCAQACRSEFCFSGCRWSPWQYMPYVGRTGFARDFCPCSCSALSHLLFPLLPYLAAGQLYGVLGSRSPGECMPCLVCWLSMSRVLSAVSGSCSARPWARLVCTPDTVGPAVTSKSLMHRNFVSTLQSHIYSTRSILTCQNSHQAQLVLGSSPARSCTSTACMTCFVSKISAGPSGSMHGHSLPQSAGWECR